MGTDIRVIENALNDEMPMISNILSGVRGLPAIAFKESMLAQIRNEKTGAKIAACTLPSIINCVITFSALALKPDGVTGQAFILPFKNVATPVVGYKGYNTLGDRAGRTITGTVWYDGDALEYEYGTNAFVTHRPMGPPGDRRIVGAWACATAQNRTPIVEVMYLEELEQTRLRSPSGTYSSSPWMDLVVGRKAMYAKTPKRRMARAMPLLPGPAGGFVMADAMEQQFDVTGRPHYILPGQSGALGIVDGITGAPVSVAPPATDESIDHEIENAAKTFDLIVDGRGTTKTYPTLEEWRTNILYRIENANPAAAAGLAKANGPILAELSSRGDAENKVAMEVSDAFRKKGN